MDNIEFFHVVKRNQDLDGKSADQSLRDSLEVIHFYEFVQVHRKHLEVQNQMLSEDQSFSYSDNILFVVWVTSFEFF